MSFGYCKPVCHLHQIASTTESNKLLGWWWPVMGTWMIVNYSAQFILCVWLHWLCYQAVGRDGGKDGRMGSKTWDICKHACRKGKDLFRPLLRLKPLQYTPPQQPLNLVSGFSSPYPRSLPSSYLPLSPGLTTLWSLGTRFSFILGLHLLQFISQVFFSFFSLYLESILCTG